MLPKEDRRAMLLRIFNDDTPVINTTIKRQAQAQEQTPSSAATPAQTEEEVLKQENQIIGQDEQEYMESRETYTKAGDEEDRFNTTV